MEKTKGWPADKVERRSVQDLVPYARNARKHSDRQVDQIAASIREWGWTIPILVDEKNGIIAGHGRVLAAKKLGIEDVPAMVATGWSDAQKRAYVIADNKLTENSTWDDELLKVELGDLKIDGFDLELTGFELGEINDLLDVGSLQDEDAPAPERPADPVSRAGDLWVLGNHRLICGDSTDEPTVSRLLDGEKPLLMVTDPPYGVNYNPEWRKHAGVNNSDRMGKVHNDNRADWHDAWKLFPGTIAYIWHSSLLSPVVFESVEQIGFSVKSLIIWNKSRFALSRGHYHWGHEPLMYATKGKAFWAGGRKQSTIWNIDTTDDGDKSIHGTQKPLECMARPIRNHDVSQVYEPFCGTGTTIVACELLDRKCFAIELDPGYVDVAIQRWQNRTGREAILESTGKPYGQVAEDRNATQEESQEEGQQEEDIQEEEGASTTA